MFRYVVSNDDEIYYIGNDQSLAAEKSVESPLGTRIYLAQSFYRRRYQQLKKLVASEGKFTELKQKLGVRHYRRKF